MANIYDPLPEESPDETTLQCAGCNERLAAATYPPGVPCPTCRSPRRRMPDGQVLPKRSILPWIILLDLVVTALIAAALVYYFVWRNPPVPPPAIEQHPGGTVKAPEPEPETPAPVAAPEPPVRPMREVAETAITFLDALATSDTAMNAEVRIDDSDGDGIPTISGSGIASELPEPFTSPRQETVALDDFETIPTITGDDFEPLEENYEPIEFVNPPQPHLSDAPVTQSTDASWSLHAVLNGNIHDAFKGRALDNSRWAMTFHESPDPCQAYFMLNREQLLVGATEARPQGPETIIWAQGITGDFETSMDFRWLLAPKDGQCGIYLECVDIDGNVLAFLDLSSWAQDSDARKVIFRCGGEGSPVSSINCPAEGRIRLMRRGQILEASLWDQAWQTIGTGPCSGGEIYLRWSGYSSSSCPRYALALDDFEVNHRRETVLAFTPRARQAPAAMDLIDADAAPETPQSTGVVSIRESPLASGARGEAYSALPYAMAALPTGSIAADLRNQSDRDLMVGLRTDREGIDLRLPAGASKRAMIPAGTYTVVMRPVDQPTHLLESDEIDIPPATSSIVFALSPSS